jgi:hypothetical protein
MRFGLSDLVGDLWRREGGFEPVLRRMPSATYRLYYACVAAIAKLSTLSEAPCNITRLLGAISDGELVEVACTHRLLDWQAGSAFSHSFSDNTVIGLASYDD